MIETSDIIASIPFIISTISIRLDASAVPGEIYERSRVELGGKQWHVAQRPIGGGSDAEASGPIEMIVYAIFNMADPARTAKAREALKEA